jgi:hypothetical protein
MALPPFDGDSLRRRRKQLEVDIERVTRQRPRKRGDIIRPKQLIGNRETIRRIQRLRKLRPK